MLRQLLKVRYIAVIIAALAVLDALAFLVLGTEAALHGYQQVLGLHGEGVARRPGLELLHSLDFLFVSLVFMVLGFAIVKLFVLGPSDQDEASLPSWLRLNDFRELKVLLWETILVTMLIIALSEMTATIDSPDRNWTVLLTPVTILLMAASLYFVKKE